MIKVKFKSFTYILLFLSFLLSSCSSRIKVPYLNKIDKSINVESNNKRVVALTSLTADLVNRLDSESLIAIPGSSLLKSNEQFKNKIVVSEGRNPPNIEKIISLEPDLVLGAKGFHDKALAKLNALGIETITSEVRNWNNLDLLIEEITEYLSVDPPPLYSLAPYCNYEPKESTANGTIVLVSSAPLLSPNKNSWAGSLLDKFNINNVIRDIQSKSAFAGYVTLSPEVLLEENPDNIIVVDTSSDMRSLFLSKSYTSALNAVNKNRVYSFDYYGLINPGSIESINNACQKLVKL